MNLDTALALKAALVVGALAIFATWERLWPMAGSPLLLRLGQPTLAAWRRLGRNLGLAGLNALLSPLIVLPITVWAAGWTPVPRPAAGAACRGCWSISCCWTSGSTGGIAPTTSCRSCGGSMPCTISTRTLDTSTALRFHFGEVALSACARAGIIVLLGFPLASVVLFEGWSWPAPSSIIPTPGCRPG